MRDSDFLYKAAITRLNPSTRDMRKGQAPHRPSRLWGGEQDRRAESLPVSAEKLAKPGGRRRSPRLARVVEVEIAGRGADGKVLVESTSTCEISRHGASLTARTPYPRSAPLAIRRSGGKPALARVVSVKSCSRPGLQQLGVGFVEDESYWEHEFPSDWQDNDGPAVEGEKPAEEPAAAHQRVHELDESLERVVRKGETLRAQARRCSGSLPNRWKPRSGKAPARWHSNWTCWRPERTSHERSLLNRRGPQRKPSAPRRNALAPLGPAGGRDGGGAPELVPAIRGYHSGGP